MKYTKDEIHFLAKSMYKAVKKAMNNELRQKHSKKAKKDAIEDLEDPNYVAEAKEKSPPRRVSTMNKSNNLNKLKKMKEKRDKKKVNKDNL